MTSAMGRGHPGEMSIFHITGWKERQNRGGLRGSSPSLGSFSPFLDVLGPFLNSFPSVVGLFPHFERLFLPFSFSFPLFWALFCAFRHPSFPLLRDSFPFLGVSLFGLFPLPPALLSHIFPYISGLFPLFLSLSPPIFFGSFF